MASPVTGAFVLHFYRERERHLGDIVRALRPLVDCITVCSNNPPPPVGLGVDVFASSRNVGTGLQVFAALADDRWTRALFVDDDVMVSSVAVDRLHAALDTGADLAALWGRDGLVNGRVLMVEREVLARYPLAAYRLGDPFAHDILLGCLAWHAVILDEHLKEDGGAVILDDCGVGLDRRPTYDDERRQRVAALRELGYP